MYICQCCKKQSKQGELSHKRVVETKEVTHPFRGDANRDGSDDKGGRGTQIVKELLVCEDCVNVDETLLNVTI